MCINTGDNKGFNIFKAYPYFFSLPALYFVFAHFNVRPMGYINGRYLPTMGHMNRPYNECTEYISNRNESTYRQL